MNVKLLLLRGLVACCVAALPWWGKAAEKTPTYWKDVLPIVQKHCQVCHRAGGIAPMAFETYKETRAYAAAIETATQKQTMPPWFAEKGVGKFSNDPSLNEEEIALLAEWVKAGAPEGNPSDALPARKWAGRWTIPAPDIEIKMPSAVKIPADWRNGIHLRNCADTFCRGAMGADSRRFCRACRRTCITRWCMFGHRNRHGCGTRR